MSNFESVPDVVLVAQLNDDDLTNRLYDLSYKKSQKLSVETKTKSQFHHINWVIDHRSLHIAKLSPKGDKRGVIEANITKSNHKFKLELCVSGWRNSQEGYCAFYLTSTSEEDLFVARYRVKVGNITRTSSIRHDFHLGVGFPNFCQQDALDNLLTSSSLQFSIAIEVFNCSSQIRNPKNPLCIESIEEPKNVISKLMNTMYEKRLHSDVYLICSNDLRIPVHKCILSHVSPVFAAMFKSNFIENKSNQIHMHQWDINTVLSMVKFIYTGKIDTDIKCDILLQNLDSDEDLDSLSFGMNNNVSPSPTPLLSSNNNSNNIDEEDDEMNDINNIRNEVDDDDEEEDMEEDSLNSSDNSTNNSNNDEDTDDINMNNNNNNNNNLLLDNETFRIFQLAEYYKIESLIISCCQQMCKELSTNNACHLLIKIQRYLHSDKIRFINDRIWKFVAQNFKRIKKTHGYTNMVTNHPKLLSILVDKMSISEN